MLERVAEEYVRIAGTREHSVGLSTERNSFGEHFYLSWCQEGVFTIKDAFERAKKKHTYSAEGRVTPVIKSKNGEENLPIP
jgi:hypothetical protein